MDLLDGKPSAAVVSIATILPVRGSAGGQAVGMREIAVSDPDGALLRFGQRAVGAVGA